MIITYIKVLNNLRGSVRGASTNLDTLIECGTNLLGGAPTSRGTKVSLLKLLPLLLNYQLEISIYFFKTPFHNPLLVSVSILVVMI